MMDKKLRKYSKLPSEKLVSKLEAGINAAQPPPFDPQTATPAELCRWAAERDGWRIDLIRGMWRIKNDSQGFKECLPKASSPDSAWAQGIAAYDLNYTTSADAAIALAARWGYEWSRFYSETYQAHLVEVWPKDRLEFIPVVIETPDNPFALALTRALCAAKMREEAK